MANLPIIKKKEVKLEPIKASFQTMSPSGSVLIWVYYSAIILYFGAEFTKVYANAHGNKIIPNAYAVSIKVEVTELPKK